MFGTNVLVERKMNRTSSGVLRYILLIKYQFTSCIKYCCYC